MVNPAPMQPMAPQNAGAIAFVSNAQIDEAARKQQEILAATQQLSPQAVTGLAGFIRQEYDTFRRHRDSASGWTNRMISGLRAFNGEYDPTILQQIRAFGGSETYARLTATKCRGASALLRDVYLNVDRPWGLLPESDPEPDPEAIRAIMDKVQIEVMDAEASGMQIDEGMMRDRTRLLFMSVKNGAKRKAAAKAKTSEDKLEDLLQKGGFYKALADVLTDLTIHPLAVMKGPVVKIEPTVVWQGNRPIIQDRPLLTWQRVSPFDVFFTPGVADIAQAAVVERQRLTRADLNICMRLPGFDHEAIRAVLSQYGTSGLTDDWDGSDATRAQLENRENPTWNSSRLITCLEYHGNVQGMMLLQQGMDPELIDDPVADYMVEAWLIGPYIIKCQLSPSPRKRHPYFVTSFEKVPGTPVGNSIPDIMADIQEAANSSMRALMNNMAMASGPQVVVNEDRLAGTETGDELHPWKRWRTNTDPMARSGEANKPIEFFQPQSNAQELLTVLQAMIALADDVSAIPRYLQGNSPGGGAGRTASGLAMLMGNASKILQTVAANVDGDILDGTLQGLLDIVLLTDVTGLLSGTESVVVKGVAVAMQRETQRARQLEFLQITGNPIDLQIMGPKGRAAVLRTVSSTLGMPGEDIVPPEEELTAQQAQSAAIGAMTGQPGFGGMGGPPPGGPPSEGGGGGENGPPGSPGNQPPRATQDAGPRTNMMQRQPAPGRAPTRAVAGGVG